MNKDLGGLVITNLAKELMQLQVVLRVHGLQTQ